MSSTVDTYLRFAERVGRLGIESQPVGLPGLIHDIQEGGAKSKTKGAIAGLRESARDTADDIVAKLRGSSDEPAESRRRLSQGRGGRGRGEE